MMFCGAKDDFSAIFVEGVCIEESIMFHLLVMEPRSSQKDATSIHGNNVPPQFIIIAFTNGKGYQASIGDL